MRRRRRYPGTKRVPGRSRLILRSHDSTNGRGREKEKEREVIRKVPSNKNIKIYRIEGTYA